MIVRTMHEAYHARCDALSCDQRQPPATDCLPGFTDRDTARDHALDLEDWVPAPDGSIYCPTHGEQLCVRCGRWLGDGFVECEVCIFCRVRYEYGPDSCGGGSFAQALTIPHAVLTDVDWDRDTVAVALTTAPPTQGLGTAEVTMTFDAPHPDPELVTTLYGSPLPDALNTGPRSDGPAILRGWALVALIVGVAWVVIIAVLVAVARLT